MQLVNEWMRERGLSITLSQTDILVLTKKQIHTIILMQVRKGLGPCTQQEVYSNQLMHIQRTGALPIHL